MAVISARKNLTGLILVDRKISHTSGTKVWKVSTDEHAGASSEAELTPELRAFVEFVGERPRAICDTLAPHVRPVCIWISGVMLQQTQVSRVDGRWQRWLGDSQRLTLAAATPSDVLGAAGCGWPSSIRATAQAISEAGGVFPQDPKGAEYLVTATAAGIRAFCV